MRDNPYHGAPYVGGMFGTRTPVREESRKKHSGEMLRAMKR